jgi:hypothetical protein
MFSRPSPFSPLKPRRSSCRGFSFSGHAATTVLCVLLIGCSSPHFVKLDASGNVDPSANPETSRRDLAECQAVEARVASGTGPLFGRGTGKVALANCMRSKGYLKT